MASPGTSLLKLQSDPFRDWNGGAACAFSSREAGNMSLAYGDTSGALENRRGFLSSLGLDYRNLVCARQAHGANIRYVTASDQGSGALAYENAIADTDGLVTDIPRLPLAIFTADCLSIFLYDPRKPAIGLIHAGWRGTKANIASCALGSMRAEFKTDPAGLLVGFGPCIRDCCYEVSADLRGDFASGVKEKRGHFFLDLAGVNKKQLLEAGVKEENMIDAGICTCCETQSCFSFRREGRASGRMLSVMALR